MSGSSPGFPFWAENAHLGVSALIRGVAQRSHCVHPFKTPVAAHLRRQVARWQLRLGRRGFMQILQAFLTQ